MRPREFVGGVEPARGEFAPQTGHGLAAVGTVRPRDLPERERLRRRVAAARTRARSDVPFEERVDRIARDFAAFGEGDVLAYESKRTADGGLDVDVTACRYAELMDELDAEQRRAVEEGLSEDELALFDLLKKENLGRAERERVKQASRDLLASIKARLAELDHFWKKEQTKAEVEVFILDEVHIRLPSPPFTTEEKEAVAAEVYAHVWQQAVSGEFAKAA